MRAGEVSNHAVARFSAALARVIQRISVSIHHHRILMLAPEDGIRVN